MTGRRYREHNDEGGSHRDNYRSGGSGSRGYRRGEGYASRSWYRHDDSKRGGNDGHERNLSEIIDVPHNKMGLIIGQGGANFKRLEAKYKVRLKLNRDKGCLNIYGERQDDINGAAGEIKDSIERDRGERVDRGDRDSSNYGKRSNDFYNNRDNKRGGFNNRNNDHNPKPDRQMSWSQEVVEQEEGERSEHRYEEAEPEPEPEQKEDPPLIDWDALNKRSEEYRKERWSKFPDVIKNFYKECPEVAGLSADEVANIRKENNNTVVGRGFGTASNDEEQSDPIPNPIWKFEQCFNDYPEILEQIRNQGFPKPTPIQAQAWPVLLKGEDMIGIAQTGTGKTLAFLLPAMIHTEFQTTPRNERSGPTVLVMAPTRELALQIKKEVDKYEYRAMKAVCVYGGGDREQQKQDCLRGCDIVICTPGRLNDFIEAGIVQITSISYLVLDEADRMLDMGFEPQIRKVLFDIRPDRQTVMTSATWPPGVRRLAKSYMQNPVTVCVGSLDLAATHSVKQLVLVMDDDDKYSTAVRFVKNMSPTDKAIIFCSKKARADDLSSEFTMENIRCQSIHGDRDQQDREQAIADITSGYVQVLVATDVASRGLDIEDVTHVINYDLPHNIEEYVHRVGRTGRAGRSGTSISYVTRDDWGVAGDLITILEEAEQEVPADLRDMAERFKAMKNRRKEEMNKAPFGRRGGGGGGGGGSYRNYGGGRSGGGGHRGYRY